MTSRISYFDGAIFRRSLKKTLPLWLFYLLVWMALLPTNLLNFNYDPARYTVPTLSGKLCREILNFTLGGATFSAFLIGLAAAWLLFSWLFSTTKTYFYASLPIRRETLFVTNYAVGLLMTTLCHLIIAALSFLITAAHGYPQLSACVSFFGASTLAFVGYYSFAVLLCMIIGHIAAMPILYVILNFTSTVLYHAFEQLLSAFVYGFDGYPDQSPLAATIFESLSPLFYTASGGLDIVRPQLESGGFDETRYIITGWRYLAIFFAVGVLLSVLAFLLMRRREMERSGDVISFGFLRPVFLYGFTIGCAVVLPFIVMSLQSFRYDGGAFWLILLYLVLSTAIGYFGAQMMLKKRISVFRGAKTWAGFAAVTLVLVLGFGALRIDLFSIYAKVPDPATVQSVDFSYAGRAEERDTIEDITAFHQLIIDRQKENEAATRNSYDTFWISYWLEDGTYLSRRYRLADDTAHVEDPDSLIRRYDEIANCDELVLKRCAIPEAFCKPDLFENCFIETYQTEEKNGISETYDSRYLSAETAYEFYTTCVLPDLLDSSLGHQHMAYTEAVREASNLPTINVIFSLDDTSEAFKAARSSPAVVAQESAQSIGVSYHFGITKEATRSAAFLEKLGYRFS